MTGLVFPLSPSTRAGTSRSYPLRIYLIFFSFFSGLSDNVSLEEAAPDQLLIGAVEKIHGDQNLTLGDAHGLVVMKDRRNALCWSTDRHLSLTGVDLAIAH